MSVWKSAEVTKMKTYEVVILEQQPTCGGRRPFKNEIRTVSTDDPVAYVQKLEPFCKLEVTEEDNGTIVISADRSGLWVRYEFSEE